MKKKHLVLLHSFPTNSLILSGLIDFMSHYFEVHAIDLPGFRRYLQPLKKISSQQYAEYVQKEIQSLQLDQYFILSICYGYVVASYMKLDNSCKGIIAVTPFISSRYLKMSNLRKWCYLISVNIILYSRIYPLVWSQHFRYFVARRFYRTYSNQLIDVIAAEIGPVTFLNTARLLLLAPEVKTLELPHLVVLSSADKVIDNVRTEKVFRDTVRDLTILHIETDHFPKDTSEAYFDQHISPEVISGIRDWCQLLES